MLTTPSGRGPGSSWVALAPVPLERSGMAAGGVNTMRQLGFALGIAAGGGREALEAAIRASFAAGLNEALLVAGAIGLVGGALSAFLLRPARVSAEEREERGELAAERSG